MARQRQCGYALNQWLTRKTDIVFATLVRWADDSAVEPATAAVCAGNLAKIAINVNDADGALSGRL